ncbi:MAG: lipoprotein-releasing ABC transporter permease subunit [Proteobacteria bacterium]|nr:lipoprotein-releasing ABC transporter permease subunit [Pseudomonadota bacterium]
MIFSPVERMVAFRYLRARRREGLISVIAAFSLAGIALGVATLIIVMAVMNGFRHELLGRILGLNGHLGVYAPRGDLADFDPLAGKLRAVAGVVTVDPMVQGQALASAGKGAVGSVVRGLRPDDVRRRALIAGNLRQGSLADFEGEDAVLIGRRLADRLGLGIGDRLTLISPEGTVTPFGTVPRMRAYRVVATFEIGMYEYDSSFVFLPLAAAQVFFRTGDAVTGLEVLLDNPDRTAAASRAIVGAAGRAVRIVDWRHANAGFFNAIEVERNVMFLILTLIILVAAFNIVSSLIMLVKDKEGAIAILRTMGATRAAIMRIFFLCGASVGVIGTFAGFLLGLSFALNIETIRQWLQGLTGTELFAAEIYFLSRLPARVDAVEVVAVVGMGLALSFLATLYPSWRAARLDPVEALRYE